MIRYLVHSEHISNSIYYVINKILFYLMKYKKINVIIEI